MDRLIGTGVALVTPFDEQQRIDRESLYRLVNYVIDGGVDFLVALGTIIYSINIQKRVSPFE